MSENDTAEGSTSRRTVLKGVGGAIATAGVSQVATANVLDDADMVEIPKAAKGDEIIRYKEVPKKFWNHLKTARRQSNKLKENIPGAVGVAKRATNDTISGRRRRKLVVQFSNEETRAAARVPETVGASLSKQSSSPISNPIPVRTSFSIRIIMVALCISDLTITSTSAPATLPATDTASLRLVATQSSAAAIINLS